MMNHNGFIRRAVTPVEVCDAPMSAKRIGVPATTLSGELTKSENILFLSELAYCAIHDCRILIFGRFALNVLLNSTATSLQPKS
jgi:hypothetical protein